LYFLFKMQRCNQPGDLKAGTFLAAQALGEGYE
jgi:hypothetical protein